MARLLPCLLLVMMALAGCGTSHPLPPYETPLAHTRAQSVRTTAYTHTEADHVEYGNRKAAVLQAIEPASFEGAEAGEGGFQAPGQLRPVSMVIEPPASTIPTVGVGSAAADWSRWPAGTVFRLASTGQVYEVDDYGWALAGRNTIDLYQPTRGAMNAWGVRREEIEILRWGDPEESLRRLRRHQEYRHIHRMVLELEGRSRAAAALE